jgi:hypothetical protein
MANAVDARQKALRNASKQRMAFPLRALVQRIRANHELNSWASYLPENVSVTSTLIQIESAGTELPRPIQLNEQKVLPCLLGSTRLPPKATNGSETISAKHLSCLPLTVPLIHTAGSPATHLIGRVWSLSQDAIGCREVQLALEDAKEDHLRVTIALELRGHVAEALRCPHANHVVQKCITSMKPTASQFILNELLTEPGIILEAARHKYGVRIIQRFLEHYPSSQVMNLTDYLLSEFSELARHPYGNYVLQTLLEHGTTEQRHHFAEALVKDAVAISQDTFGCAVISSAMSYLERNDQLTLARRILHVPGLWALMSHARHGHQAVRCILQVLEGTEHDSAKQKLRADLPALRVSRYGRLVAAFLESETDSL